MDLKKNTILLKKYLTWYRCLFCLYYFSFFCINQGPGLFFAFNTQKTKCLNHILH